MPVAQATSVLDYGLIAAGVLLTVLLAALLWMLFGPKDRRKQRPHLPSAGPTLTPPPASFGQTRRLPAEEPAPPSGAQPARTRLFVDLGVELSVERGPDRDQTFPLHQHLTLIGRAGARANDIELTDGTVSKEQASIRYQPRDEAFSILNESSTNPTLVDRKVVEGEVTLELDTRIDMGGTTLLFRSS